MTPSGLRQAVLLSMALGSGSIQAVTHCVPLSHPGPCAQWHATIQGAVTAAAAGDELRVAAGSYPESVVIDRSLTLGGAQAGVDARDRSASESILTHSLGPLTVSGCGHHIVIDGARLSHFTQVVWTHTTRLGCGKATGNSYDYLVCNYDPAGNFIGQSPFGK